MRNRSSRRLDKGYQIINHKRDKNGSSGCRFLLQKALYCGKIWRIEYETEGVEVLASVKRETGASPVRTRHRNYGVYATRHW